MYQHSYAEVLADSTRDARAAEYRALDEAATRLRQAAGAGPGSPEERDALDFASRLWTLLITDLASPGNDLPNALRANLISVGLGVLGEVGRVHAGLSRDLDGLADICADIRDGLV